jgi:hypothetical protein
MQQIAPPGRQSPKVLKVTSLRGVDQSVMKMPFVLTCAALIHRTQNTPLRRPMSVVGVKKGTAYRRSIAQEVNLRFWFEYPKKRRLANSCRHPSGTFFPHNVK